MKQVTMYSEKDTLARYWTSQEKRHRQSLLWLLDQDTDFEQLMPPPTLTTRTQEFSYYRASELALVGPAHNLATQRLQERTGLRANSPAAHKHIRYWTSFQNHLFQQLLDIQNAELAEEQSHADLKGITFDTDSEDKTFVTPPTSPIPMHRSIEIQTDLSLTATNVKIDLDHSPPCIYL